MSQRRWLALGGVLALVVALLAFWSAPDTGPDPETLELPEPEPEPVALRQAPVPRSKAPQPAAPEALVEDTAIHAKPRVQPWIPAPEVDLEPSSENLLLAAMNRRDDLIDCYDDFYEAGGDLPGRFTLNLSVSNDELGGALVTASLPEPMEGTEDLEACMDAAFADAPFLAPEGTRSMLWPVPMSGKR